MKKVFAILSIAGMLLATTGLSAQDKKEDKSKRPSPPAKVSEKIRKKWLYYTGRNINYSRSDYSAIAAFFFTLSVNVRQ